MEIRSTPTTLFINKAGAEEGRAAGTHKCEQVLAALAAIKKVDKSSLGALATSWEGF